MDDPTSDGAVRVTLPVWWVGAGEGRRADARGRHRRDGARLAGVAEAIAQILCRAPGRPEISSNGRYGTLSVGPKT
ncbi:hypothetical protein, partial [Methylosinus sp. R-45379]|uniref:hypothetical protein n=1 Tax=Methylosinus sp. R-45379 TaxID=980563 RepID=UPI001AEC7B09